MPLATAPGMGINSALGALVAYGDGSGHRWSYENVMALTFIYSTIVLVISVVPIGRDPTGGWLTMREKLLDGIPLCVRSSIPAGIGLFVAFIGCQSSKLVISNPNVLLEFVPLTKLWSTGPGTEELRLAAKSGVVCQISINAIASLAQCDVKGSVVIGMLIGTVNAIPLHVADTDIIAGKKLVTWAFWKNFENYFKWNGKAGGIFFGCFRGFNFPKGSELTVVMNIISLGIADLFGSIGNVIALATKAGLLDEDGNPQSYGRTMVTDSIAALSASLLGTSSVTTYVESGTGIAVGGKTGLVALTVSVAFLLSVFFLPIFAFMPQAAAGAALIYVGVLMMSTVAEVDFTEVHNALPAFLTIVMMPFTYSITNGIGLGLLSYVLLVLIDWLTDMVLYCVKYRGQPGRTMPKWPIGIVTGIISVMFVVYFLVPSDDLQ
jgi:AGZA family xanthine/uracil permease-like MFS transporter